MRHISSRTAIQEILAKRLVLEQNLSHALMGAFRTGQLNKDLLHAIYRMLNFLVTLLDQIPTRNVLNECEKDASFLLGLKNHYGTAAGVMHDLLEFKTLPVEECGDLIRFYGEVIDKLAEKVGGGFLSDRARQIGWRYGGGGEAWRAQHDPTHRALADKGMVWQKKIVPGSKGEQGKGGRIREKAKEHAVKVFASGPSPFYSLVPGESIDKDTYSTLRKQGSSGAGANQWVLTEKSTVKKIDMVFGLPFAADISGTTTDTMHFMSGYSNVGQKDPIIFMLPLATIVSQYHHSVLEVALAMSLKKVINYAVGFYSTLLPSYTGSNQHPNRGDIVGILDSFEQHADNQHILVYYRNGQIGGAFVADPSEYEQFKKLATCDIRFWPRFNSMQTYPTQDDVLQFMAHEGLRETVALRGSPVIYTPRVLRGV